MISLVYFNGRIIAIVASILTLCAMFFLRAVYNVLYERLTAVTLHGEASCSEHNSEDGGIHAAMTGA